VEASLGADSIRHGLQAGAVGLAAVVATMLLYYRWAGANATLALLLNGVLLIAALSCFGGVLTLPGIAGAVLTIGMAVDSNVLIFERIREELQAGRSASGALAAGFSKAFATLGGYSRDHRGLVHFPVLLWDSSREGIRNHSRDRPDDQPVHIRLRFTSSFRLGVVEARTIPAIEHRDTWLDRHDRWYGSYRRGEGQGWWRLVDDSMPPGNS
jgi:hypothetical protein